MTDLTQIVGNVETSRKKIAETLDRFTREIEGPSDEEHDFVCIVEKVQSASDSEELWDARDRMDEIRGGLYKLRKSTARNYAEASDAYYDAIRQEKSRGGNSGHYEEREAKYEMKHIHEYKIMRNLERTLSDIETFSYYFEGRLRWVKDRLKWVRENEQWSRMKY